MEIIRKKICLDGYKSHVNGIFPYIFYDSNNCSIQVDNELDNYGDFACDIVKKSNGNRLRYLEALRKYYQVTNIIKNALFTPQCHSGCSWTSGITFLNENFCENISGCSISTFDNFEENSDFSLSLGRKVDKEGNFVTKSWAGSGKTTYGYDYIGEPTPIKQYIYYAKDSGIWPQCLYGRFIAGTTMYDFNLYVHQGHVPADYKAAVSGWFYTDKEETQVFDGKIRRGGPSGEIIVNIYDNCSFVNNNESIETYIEPHYMHGHNSNYFFFPGGNAELTWEDSRYSDSGDLTYGGNVIITYPTIENIVGDPSARYYLLNYDGALNDVGACSNEEYAAHRYDTFYAPLTSGTSEVCGGSMSVTDFILKYGCLNQQMFVSEDEKNILNSIGKWWKTFWGRHLLKFDITDDAIRFWLEFRQFFIGPKRDTLLTVLNLNPGESFDSNDNYWNNGEVVNTFDIVSPYIEVPICLEQTKTDEGLYTTYEYDLSGDSIVESENTSDLIVNTSFSGLNMPVNSQLYNLVSPDAVIYKDINGNDVIGIPNALGIIEPSGNVDLDKLKAKNGNGQLYLCHYKSGTTIENGAFNIKQSGETLYYYWVAVESNDNITTRLTEPEINTPGYVEVQYVTSIPSIITVDNLEPGDDIYVKAKYDKTLLIPYSATDLTQLESGKYYNVIKKITNSGNTYFKIDYALNVNGSNSGNTGFHYRDIVKYKLEKKTVLVNDIYETEISAYTLDIESSTLLSGETTNVEYQDGKLPLMFFNPAMDGLVDPPEVSVDFSLDRGSAAAWERHFKLMECNTMEDLENYGNNYFNARQ